MHKRDIISKLVILCVHMLYELQLVVMYMYVGPQENIHCLGRLSVGDFPILRRCIHY